MEAVNDDETRVILTKQDKIYEFTFGVMSVARFRKVNKNFFKSVVLTNFHEMDMFIQLIK